MVGGICNYHIFVILQNAKIMYIKDLDLIERHSRKNEDINWRFRSYLKIQDGRRIDRVVKPIYEDVIKEINCLECGNCCRKLMPVLNTPDIARLMKFLNLDEGGFLENYTQVNEFNEINLKGNPCIFLQGNACEIYNIRPDDCRSFPHVHKKEFTTRMIGVIEFAAICPIVFNVLEELKTSLKFR
jgi:uncharacterized protein